MRTLKKPLTPAMRMSSYRYRMRQAGMKPVQIWVPDPNALGFAEKCREQAHAISKSDPAGEDALRFVETTFEWPDD